MLLQVRQEAAAFAYQLHEAAVRGEILFVLLQVAADLGDALREQGNLAFDGTRVCSRATVLGKDAGFLFFGQ